MTTAQQIALWADQVRGIAALGLHYAQNVYEKERYSQLQTLALTMLAFATAEPAATLEPLRATVFAQPTPLAVGDAAIIDAQGRILLIQRADNQQWAMPGGVFDVGETPAEGAVREALEETGVYCQAVGLVGVFDSRHWGTASRHHLYQFVFLCQPLDQAPVATPSHGHEVLNTGWFAEGALPVDLDPGHAQRIPVAFQVWRGERSAYFD